MSDTGKLKVNHVARLLIAVRHARSEFRAVVAADHALARDSSYSTDRSSAAHTEQV